MTVGSIERVREVRERLVTAGTVVCSDGRSRELFPVAIGDAEGLALRSWVRREGAQRTLETGLGFAISTLFLVEGLLENGSNARHVATDPYQFESLPIHRVICGSRTQDPGGGGRARPRRVLCRGVAGRAAEAARRGKGVRPYVHRRQPSLRGRVRRSLLLRPNSSKKVAWSSSMTRSWPVYGVPSTSTSRTLTGRPRIEAKKVSTSGSFCGPAHGRHSRDHTASSWTSRGDRQFSTG
jgi:hypothetical protein